MFKWSKYKMIKPSKGIGKFGAFKRERNRNRDVKLLKFIGRSYGPRNPIQISQN